MADFMDKADDFDAVGYLCALWCPQQLRWICIDEESEWEECGFCVAQQRSFEAGGSCQSYVFRRFRRHCKNNFITLLVTWFDGKSWMAERQDVVDLGLQAQQIEVIELGLLVRIGYVNKWVTFLLPETITPNYVCKKLA